MLYHLIVKNLLPRTKHTVFVIVSFSIWCWTFSFLHYILDYTLSYCYRKRHYCLCCSVCRISSFPIEGKIILFEHLWWRFWLVPVNISLVLPHSSFCLLFKEAWRLVSEHSFFELLHSLHSLSCCELFLDSSSLLLFVETYSWSP